jgi:hypothetical protein
MEFKMKVLNLSLNLYQICLIANYIDNLDNEQECYAISESIDSALKIIKEKFPESKVKYVNLIAECDSDAISRLYIDEKIICNQIIKNSFEKEDWEYLKSKYGENYLEFK